MQNKVTHLSAKSVAVSPHVNRSFVLLKFTLLEGGFRSFIMPAALYHWYDKNRLGMRRKDYLTMEQPTIEANDWKEGSSGAVAMTELQVKQFDDDALLLVTKGRDGATFKVRLTPACHHLLQHYATELRPVLIDIGSLPSAGSA